MTVLLARRRLLAGGFTSAALAATGCGAASKPAPAPDAAMLVHRDPGCGCCLAWADQARAAGYGVRVRDTQDMTSVKQRLGVPPDLASCHTVEVAGLVIEGHVPFPALAQLRSEPLPGVIGLAVPGMPRGSPGMETPDGTRDPFTVYAFRRDGARRPYV
jgi:hypothetical protein